MDNNICIKINTSFSRILYVNNSSMRFAFKSMPCLFNHLLPLILVYKNTGGPFFYYIMFQRMSQQKLKTCAIPKIQQINSWHRSKHVFHFFTWVEVSYLGMGMRMNWNECIKNWNWRLFRNLSKYAFYTEKNDFPQ